MTTPDQFFSNAMARTRNFRILLGPQYLIFVAGALCLAATPWLSDTILRSAALVIGSALVVYGFGRILQDLNAGPAAAGTLPSAMQDFVMRDSSAIIISDAHGQIAHMNLAADALFSETKRKNPAQIAHHLTKFTASPAAIVARLIARAQVQGSSHDDIVTQEGTLRVAVQHYAAGAALVWRIDQYSGSGRAGADTLSLPLLTANKAGVVLFSNRAMRELVGKRPKSLTDLAAADAWRSGEEIEIATANGPATAMFTELPSTGERREIYLMPLPAAQTPASLRTDFEIVPVALAIFAPNGEMRAANYAARDILGASYREGAFVHEMFDFLGRPVSDWLADVADGRLPSDTQFLRLNMGSSDKNNFVQVSLRRMVENARPMVLAVIQDGNAIKTLEAQFVQSQKMQAIGQLAGGVAHDFNNLLTAISGNCDLLLLRHAGDDPSFPDLMQIRQNANRAASLVGQLLAFSRKQNLQPEYLDMSDVFSDLTHLLNRLVGEKLHLRLTHGTGIGQIRADRRQLEQVIVNLVVNARDAMPQGGTVALTTEKVHFAADFARNRASVPAGDYVKISVADTGTGMSDEIMQKIFEPFFTTKKTGEGTGLGLSTAYGIVKQSGGYIFADSQLGVGTTFTLYFPVHIRPLDMEKPAAAPASVIRQGEGVVLLVEDEGPVRAFAARALRLRGYTVLEAVSGEEALAIVRAGGVHVDLFLSDVIMPGMDGPTWVRAAQDFLPDVPVIFVSGYAEDVMSEHQQRIANATFLPKPFSLAELTLVVQEKLLASKKGGPSVPVETSAPVEN